MSFSSDTKKELCEIEAQSRCCKKAEVYGLLLFSHLLDVTGDAIYRTKHEYIARKVSESIASYCGVSVDITTPAENDTKTIYTVSIPFESDRKKLADAFGDGEMIRSIHISKACCFATFLRSVFIVCGSLTDPKKDYHIEFDAGEQTLRDSLIELLSLMNYKTRGTQRKGDYLAYSKDGENIEQLLLEMGAKSAYFDLSEQRAVRVCMNNAQRLFNCDKANMVKTSRAAAEQVAAIKKICEGPGLDSLPEELREIARLRLENPGMTLSEMVQELEEPLTRSGVNHRLKRIMEISRK